MKTSQALKVGIIGQGRSGRDIHANHLIHMSDYYQITAVVDLLQERRESAIQRFGCRAYETYEAMVEQEQLDLVINTSPSHLHFPITLDLLQRGFHVLCEKPLARLTAEVDLLIEASNKSGKLLAIFQQSRYLPAFVQIRRVIESGVLGRIIQIDFNNSAFARRWDWQTLQSSNGGNLSNVGSHTLDQALQLFGADMMPQIHCIMDRVNTFGDAEDYVKLIMRGQGRPTIDMEVSSCSAYPDDSFKIQGELGGLHGNPQRLEWKYFKPEEAPQQELVSVPLINNQGEPAYCSEDLTWYHHNWEASAEESRFEYMTQQMYESLYHTLTAGAPLEITPEQIRRQMAVMEECRRQNPHIYK
ncbi:Gfo/Idh/MocA family protein [Paenibacillus eucommiae]|uniref:Dehydrogenase n=1 Tax=Paenibacillus eucommiae TaxID=1355755 RepID=A0ABS4IPH1_9BACL|nr:Gfo/Idh/MocA family oxidoreductase [Paenibacillus eucommiae]MBP1989467.1 putative dehydrogenase [Paenibacillus eucommiae]